MSTSLQLNIKKQLLAKNMSAAELERRTGIPHAVINILHGRSKNPSIRTAQAIAKELGCTVEQLFADTTTETQKIQLEQKTKDWDPELYRQICNALLNSIQKAQINPKPEIVAQCITEAYLYCLGSPTQTLDQRFIEWLVSKNFQGFSPT